MKFKYVDISAIKNSPVLQELTAEQEAAIIAQYKAERTPEAIEADYQDIEKQLADSIPSDFFFQDLME